MGVIRPRRNDLRNKANPLPLAEGISTHDAFRGMTVATNMREGTSMKVLRKITLVGVAITATMLLEWTAHSSFGNQSRERTSNDSIGSWNPQTLASHSSKPPSVLIDLRLAPRSDSRSRMGSTPSPDGPANNSIQADHKPAFWIIDTRSIPGSMLNNPTEALKRIRLFSVDACGTLEDLTTEDWPEDIDEGKMLWLVVHGNRVTSNEAVVFMKSFRRVAEDIGIDGQFVLWSWPSGVMVRGIARDSRLKAGRADSEASLLAAWLARHPWRSPIVLVGYSFGARTVMRAVSQLAVEQSSTPVARSATISQTKVPRAFVLFLVAPAIDSATFERLARQAVEHGISLKVVITVNQSDPALRWYRHLWSCHGPNALGWQGPYCSTIRDLGEVLEILNVTRQVGHTHRWETYLDAPSLRRSLHTTASFSISP